MHHFTTQTYIDQVVVLLLLHAEDRCSVSSGCKSFLFSRRVFITDLEHDDSILETGNRTGHRFKEPGIKLVLARTHLDSVCLGQLVPLPGLNQMQLTPYLEGMLCKGRRAGRRKWGLRKISEFIKFCGEKMDGKFENILLIFPPLLVPKQSSKEDVSHLEVYYFSWKL